LLITTKLKIESEKVMQNWCNVVQVAGSLSHDSNILGSSLLTENEQQQNIIDQSSAILLVPNQP
jgi:hypothetical protein